MSENPYDYMIGALVLAAVLVVLPATVTIILQGLAFKRQNNESEWFIIFFILNLLYHLFFHI